jgi:hypothetical protein
MDVEVAMPTLTIALPEDLLIKLQAAAARLQVTPEELASVSIEELLRRPDETFQRTVNSVLKKNADLYRRLT